MEIFVQNSSFQIHVKPEQLQKHPCTETTGDFNFVIILSKSSRDNYSYFICNLQFIPHIEG